MVLSAGSIPNSVLDVFSMRGANFNFNPVAISIGLRSEGLLAYDLFRGSYGIRRAGPNPSVEPGVYSNLKKYRYMLMCRSLLNISSDNNN